MDIVYDHPGSGLFSEVYLYEELMEADLHAIVSLASPESLQGTVRTGIEKGACGKRPKGEGGGGGQKVGKKCDKEGGGAAEARWVVVKEWEQREGDDT